MSRSVFFFFGGLVSNNINGNTIIIIANMTKTPIPKISPKSLVSFIFVIHKEKKPIDVVKLVKNKVVSVNFLNVPSYVTATQVVAKTSMGEISVDVSFGGAFYASVDLDNLAISISPEHLEKLL